MKHAQGSRAPFWIVDFARVLDEPELGAELEVVFAATRSWDAIRAICERHGLALVSDESAYEQ